MALSLLASIGFGFVISLASGSDAQAVQNTMILLLAGLFFSGPLVNRSVEGSGHDRRLAAAGHIRNAPAAGEVMLRDAPLDIGLLLGLVAYGVVSFGLAL